MKTYTPDEYRQMARSGQFGKSSRDGSFNCGWLVAYEEGREKSFLIGYLKWVDGYISETYFRENFIPCEEPKELEV